MNRDESTEFQFDAVLPPTATQSDVFAVAARPVIADVLNGYNGTVMAYGQTGAGKTYTLSSTLPGQFGEYYSTIFWGQPGRFQIP